MIFARAYWNVEDKLFAVKVSNMQMITTDKQIKRRGLCGLFYKACTYWKFLPYFTHLALFSLIKQVHGFIHCLRAHVNFTRVNKIEATYGSSRENVQVGPRSTFTFRRQGGSLAEWSARRPAVRGSSSALVTCWLSSRSSRVEIVGHGINSQLVASCQLGFLILLCCIEWFVSKYLTGVSVS